MHAQKWEWRTMSIRHINITKKKKKRKSQSIKGCHTKGLSLWTSTPWTNILHIETKAEIHNPNILKQFLLWFKFIW